MIINKFKDFNSEPYAEVSQVNPLRWMNLKPIEGGYEAVSHWWKCKDFLNDAITAKWLNKSFSIYGFKCDPKVFYSENQKDMPLLLKGTLAGFEHNVGVVNDFLDTIGMPPIELEPQEDGMFIITIPELYLDNTLFISTITLYIRLANTENTYLSLDEMIKDPVNRDSVRYYEATKQKPMNKYPEKLKPYVWYYGSYNCPKDGSNTNFMTSTMHNCGVVNFTWSI